MKKRHPENRHNPQTREISIKREFLELIRSGQKTLELRVGFPSFRKLEEGADITFVCENKDPVTVTVTAIREYTSLKSVLETEDMNRLAPGIQPQQISQLASQLFPKERVSQYGLLVIEFTLKSNTP